MADVTKIDAGETLSLAGTTIGRFALRERLGAGGMGEVYRADDTKLNRSVAIKRMSGAMRSDPEYRRRFIKEAERASQLNDPHIAALYDILEEQGEIFLVMEFVEGCNLRELLTRETKLKDFLGIAIQAAEGLRSAHARNIVHCDIKPENIMISSSGLVKILDFGVARQLTGTGWCGICEWRAALCSSRSRSSRDSTADGPATPSRSPTRARCSAARAAWS